MDFPEELRGRTLSRRDLLSYAGMIGASTVVGEAVSAWSASPSWGRLIQRAAATRAAGSDLGAIEHIVFLMMENRSYDHYFGAYPRAAASTTTQALPRRLRPGLSRVAANLVPKHKLLPFHLDSQAGFECTDDLTHDWGPMHECWNHGRWTTGSRSTPQPHTRAPHGAMTMGYYERADLPFHWALADTSRCATPTTARSSARPTPTG